MVQGKQSHPQPPEDQGDGCRFMQDWHYPPFTVQWSSCGKGPLCQVPRDASGQHPHLAYHHHCVIEKVHQCLYFLRKLKRGGLDADALRSFNTSVEKSIRTSAFTVWCSSCTVTEKKVLQRVVKFAQRTIRYSLPSLRDISTTRCRTRAKMLHMHCAAPGQKPPD